MQTNKVPFLNPSEIISRNTPLCYYYLHLPFVTPRFYMQEFSLSWDTNNLICQWKSNSSVCNCTNSKPPQMGHSNVRETAQFLFTFQYLISNNYSSGTISKAKYILHCKCKIFVSGFGHKPYLVHKRRKFSSYKILN